MNQIAAQRAKEYIISIQKEACFMRAFTASELETATVNISNSNCGCGQIAYRVVRVNVDQKPTEVPLCGRHYIEALKSVRQDSGPAAPSASIALQHSAL